MKTPEEILEESITFRKMIEFEKYSCVGIPYADALNAVKKAITQCQQYNAETAIHFATWYSAKKKEDVITAFELYLIELQKLTTLTNP